MKININNSSISGETRMEDMPRCFIFCVDGEPLSAWKKVFIDDEYAAPTSEVDKNILYMSFLIGSTTSMEFNLINKSSTVNDVFNMEKGSFIPVDKITIDEVSIDY